MVRVKAELSAPRVLELVVPRFDDVGDITGSVPVALDLSASLDVQLVFWERSGVAKELECVNVEEGCPRCKFASFLRGLVILKRRGALHINGAYVIEGDFARLRLQIEGVNDIGAAAIEEFSFVQCHLQLQNTAHAGKTEKDKVAAAMRSRCHVVGCNLHKWKMSRTQVMTPERVNLTPTRVSAPSPSSIPSSAHASRVARAPPSSSSPEKAVRSTPEIQEPAGEASSPSPSIADNDVECSGDRTIMEPAPSRKLNLRDVFDSLMTPIAAQTEMWSPHIPGLDLTLYEHQRRGLSWMMKREEATLWETTLRHPFSVPGRLRHASDHLLESEFGDTARDVCGGMLCDEPGLGKTITMLALILLTKGQSTSEMPVRVDAPTSNTASVQLRSSSRGPALQADSMVSSSACLIVVPDALVDHWEEQIEAHVVNQGLRTYVDKAVAGSLPESNRLARYDVVIVSFSRMAKEWKLHRPPSALEARRAPRFGFEDQPDRYLDGSIRGEVSSLLSIHWLRVIVDEGHKLGGRAPTQLMQMSRLLCAERRWVMTGTPSPNTLQSADLLYIHGLLVFLRNQPYGRPDGFAWSKAIARPFERNEPVGFHRLQHLLSRIMVRHTKDSIRDKLPRPIRHTVVVDPTPSEFKLYNAIAERVRANLVVTAIDVPAKAAKADASSSVHPKSLLNRKNHKDAGHIETALAFAFMGGYAVNWTMKSKHKIRTLEKLCECGVSESRVSAVVEYLSTADVYVKDVLQCKKTRCGDCGFERRILMVLPCGHLCCGYCVDDLKKEIDECRCNFCDEPYDEDECSYLQPTLTGEVTERGRQSTLRKLREHGVSDAKLARVAAYMDTLKPKPATECIGCHRQLHLLLILTCGHLSCPDCVEQRNQQAGPSCPLCHESFSRKGFRDLQPGIRSEALEDNDKPARRKKPRVVTVKKRKRAAPAPKKRAVNYKRDYWKIDSSKISYMAARIRELTEEFARERDRDLKVIIFSQFRESIWRAKVAFQQQDIPTADFIALINPRERIRNLEAFRSNPNVHVLLLSNMGSHGLDLSFVTHIFLLEEIWDKSVEMQVISRAHRMGAKRSVVVEQLWMRGTVECQLNSTNQQLFKSDHSTGSSESPQHQPTREEVQEASSADKNSFQQLKMHYILNSLRVLKDDVVGKEGEVRFSVRDESETIIRQGVHTISDSGEISTVSTLPNPPPRPPAAAACTRPSVSPQQGPASTTRASRKKPDPPQVIVIDDSSDDERSSGCDSDSEEKCEENSTVIPMPRQDPLIPVKQEPVHAPVIPVRKPAVVPVKLEPVYIEIKDEDTESE